MIASRAVSYNTKLITLTAVVGCLIVWKLYQIALVTDNMNGFWYSAIHVLLVSLACVFSLKR